MNIHTFLPAFDLKVKSEWALYGISSPKAILK